MDPKTYEPPQPPLITQIQPVQMPLLPQVSYRKRIVLFIIETNGFIFINFSMLLQAEHRKVVFGCVAYRTRLESNIFYIFWPILQTT